MKSLIKYLLVMFFGVLASIFEWFPQQAILNMAILFMFGGIAWDLYILLAHAMQIEHNQIMICQNLKIIHEYQKGERQ